MRNKRAKLLMRQAKQATKGQPFRAVVSAGGQRILDPNCTRSVYRWLKREYTRGGKP